MEAVNIDRKSYQIGGIILLILGLIGMFLPEFASGMFLVLVAAILILGGIMFFIAGFHGGWLNYILGIILLAVGILMFVYPSHSLSAMTFLMGAWFLLMGIVQTIFAFAIKSEYNGWWSPLIVGVLSFILGILVFMGWPGNSDWIIGLFIGIELFLDGIMLLMLSAYGE